MSSAFKNMFDDSAIYSSKMISRLTKDGFITTNDVEIKGPIILLNGDLFMWDVPQGQGLGQIKDGKGGVFDNWIINFLKLFEVVIPRPELLIFGTGKSFIPIPSHIKQYLNDLGIQTEIVDTSNAIATYNVLAEEGRMVAAALLPLTPTSARTGNPL
ncbi:NADH dehydrogenase 1 alpha subcomplex assembly factor 3 [Glomus cerebriforme]|uniref:NADH dehydrogenase 1 alpha subcomplex assembly factor 3 n=1 Tax=Glomus cerebriforme TaxID=658196 RepID=A0A397TDY8_9GLOM|nr:NADH dehydrogenase 1 alpha subcomplex assembly factor 3 [Glomus cerebriforme]